MNLLPIKSEQDNRKQKLNIKMLLPHSSLFTCLTTSSPWVAQKDRDCGLCSVHHTYFCLSFLLRERTSHTPSGSTMGALPWKTVLHELLQCESFLQAEVLYEILWHDPLHGVQSFRNRLLQHEKGHDLLWYRVFHKLQVDTCSTVNLRDGCKVNHQLSHGLHRRTSTSLSGAPLSFSSLTLMSDKLFHIFSLLFSSCCCTAEAFPPPFLNMLS